MIQSCETEASHAASFVGRDREMAELRRLLRDAASGSGRLVLLTGEPGIGKTRLAEELANENRREGGVATWWGRCWEGRGAQAFWPWVQIVRNFLEDCDPHAAKAALGSGAQDIAVIVPEVRKVLHDLPVPIDTDPEGARFRLFDSMSSFVKAASKRQPRLLVLDDIHWADSASLLLVEFLAEELRGSRTLVLGIAREPGPCGSELFPSMLGRLARVGTSMRLDGLAPEAVELLIARSTGRPVREGQAKEMHDRTGGNPFFLTQLIDLLRTDDGDEHRRPAVPCGVRQVIVQRLEPLSAACVQALRAAAVIGPRFDLVLLEAACTALPRQRLLSVLDEARLAGIVTSTANPAGSYAFVHALVREVLCESLTAFEASTLHARIGETLELFSSGERELRLAELAHHFARASALGTVDKALRYATEAGTRSLALLAFEDAVQHFESALALMERHPEATGANGGETRSELRLAAADARMRSGDIGGARKACLEIARDARARRDSKALARATLIYSSRRDVQFTADPALIGMFVDSLAARPAADDPLRALLLGRLAVTFYFTPQHSRCADLSEEAVAVAERCGDPVVLATALEDRSFALLGPNHIEERIAVGTTSLHLAYGAGAREAALRAHFWRLRAYLECGNMAAVEIDMDGGERLAEELRQPFYRWWATLLRAMLATLEGRFDDGERLAQEALALGQQAQCANAPLAFGLQLFSIHRERGSLTELAASLRTMVDQYPNLLPLRCALVSLYVQMGLDSQARVEVERVARHDFEDLPRDANWMAATVSLAQAAAHLDAARARRLYDILLPHEGRVVVAALGDACYGAVSRYLGLLADALRLRAEAARHFEAAIRTNRDIGAPPSVAHAQREYAALLLRDGDPRDVARAGQLLSEAISLYEGLGMSAFAAVARSMRPAAPPTPIREIDGEPDAATTTSEFRRDGDHWHIAYEGIAVRFRHNKGLLYLAHLLAHPVREFHVFDLVRLIDPLPPEAATPTQRRRAAMDPAAPRLDTNAPIRDGGHADARACAEYRERLIELRAELTEVEQNNDIGRTAVLRARISVLESELVSAHLSTRSPSDAVEKAHKSVTNRIRNALDRIRAVHPALWRHLHRSTCTGTFCSYSPQPGTSWNVPAPVTSPSRAAGPQGLDEHPKPLPTLPGPILRARPQARL